MTSAFGVSSVSSRSLKRSRTSGAGSGTFVPTSSRGPTSSIESMAWSRARARSRSSSSSRVFARTTAPACKQRSAKRSRRARGSRIRSTSFVPTGASACSTRWANAHATRAVPSWVSSARVATSPKSKSATRPSASTPTSFTTSRSGSACGVLTGGRRTFPKFISWHSIRPRSGSRACRSDHGSESRSVRSFPTRQVASSKSS